MWMCMSVGIPEARGGACAPRARHGGLWSSAGAVRALHCSAISTPTVSLRGKALTEQGPRTCLSFSGPRNVEAG